MTVVFHDPRGRSVAEPEPYDLALDLSRADVTVALVANSYPGCVEFLEHLETALVAQRPSLRFRMYRKPSVSHADDGLVDSVAAECGAVVAAYGH
jgi:hypothetical protein